MHARMFLWKNSVLGDGVKKCRFFSNKMLLQIWELNCAEKLKRISCSPPRVKRAFSNWIIVKSSTICMPCHMPHKMFTCMITTWWSRKVWRNHFVSSTPLVCPLAAHVWAAQCFMVHTSVLQLFPQGTSP